ncbi:excinuclease ABC subunit UvrA [Rothia uropygioeca]|uniref:excinuclease ABC subunit UvrA n=1 Tax=Kocuria sp. 257 TaxID=2021970 RepID=UPI00101138EB|nr:excinuclease ABC subunit UvrA [Kocuria sp. 257]
MPVPEIHPDQRRPDGVVAVHDAHLHNLQHVSTEFPRGALVAFTGVSGSGKSSLAFGTIHGESQRRYLESIAPFARRLIGSTMDPRVESLTGLPPTVALEQRNSAGGARSTVGTITTLSNGIRLLYSRAGNHPAESLQRGSALHGGRLLAEAFSPNTPEGMCPQCHGAGVLHEPTERSMVPDPNLSINDGAIQAWPGAWLGKNFHDILFTLDIVDMDLPWREIPQEIRDWILFTEDQPVIEVHPERGVDQTQRTYQGRWRSVNRYLLQTVDQAKSEKTRARALKYLDTFECPTCHGHRLNPDALRVEYLDQKIYELNSRSAKEILELFQERWQKVSELDETPETEAERLLLPNVVPVLETMVGLGLGHLSLDRPARTLSTGEMQRLRLSAQLRSGLFGVAYVLDEPSAGLHPSEKGVLLDLFERFIEDGNSVLLVEHDMRLVERADWAVDVGPAAGVDGGHILHSGPVADLAQVKESKTAPYLYQPLPDPRTADAVRTATSHLSMDGVTARNVRDVSVSFPLGTFVALTGVSGAGKSTLLGEVLAPILRKSVRSSVLEQDEEAGKNLTIGKVSGTDAVDRLVQITQKPIGRSPRSCLATYTGLFDRVRKLFASTLDAQARGWGIGRFSFNVTEGRCPTCQGEGQIEVELVFLPGSYSPCPECHGARYNPETLEVSWNGKNVSEVLSLSVRDALDFFADEEHVCRSLRALDAIGLGYLTLGQPATELSGGEAQRIKLATELQRAPRGHTVYLLDEPTTGLHPSDVDLLVAELNRLVDQGNTVVVAEHDLRVVAGADWVIDLGPGAGERGGQILVAGPPADVAACDESATGRWMRGEG